MSAPGSPINSQWRRRQLSRQPGLQRQQSECVLNHTGSSHVMEDGEDTPPNHCCRLVILGSANVGELTFHCVVRLLFIQQYSKFENRKDC